MSIAELLAKDAADQSATLVKYRELCKARDAAYAKAAPIQKKLDEQIAITQASQAKELELAAQIEAAWGPDWVKLKKRIAELARILVRVPHE